MAHDFLRGFGYRLVLQATGVASALCAGSAHAGEDAMSRLAIAEVSVAANCANSGSGANPPACAKPVAARPEALQSPRARITVGRAVDLLGQEPVRYLSSESLDQSRSFIMSSTGRLRDTVRLISPPPSAGAAGAANGGAPSGAPVRWSGLTSRFGMRFHPLLNQSRLHAGIDLRAAMGDPVRATSAGVVQSAGWQGGYGLAVRIDHGRGIETRYAHLSRLNVGSGQVIKPGDIIGFVGSTGRSTGPHLHYEVRQNGRPVDPSSTLGK